MDNLEKKLEVVKEAEEGTNKSLWVTTPKDILKLIGWSRRIPKAIEDVEKLFDKYQVVAEPSFAHTYHAALIIIKKGKKEKEVIEEQTETPQPIVNLVN